MVRFLELLYKPQTGHYEDNNPGLIRLTDEKRIWDVKVYYIHWSTKDNRYIVADLYKGVFGLKKLGVKKLDGMSEGLIGTYNKYDRPLKDFNPKLVRPEAMKSIRATLAFRLILGMRANNDVTTVIRDKYPLSRKDAFWRVNIPDRTYQVKISEGTYKRWFADNSNPISYVKQFPIWRRMGHRERMNLFDNIKPILLKIAETYGCVLLYNYTTHQLRRALNSHEGSESSDDNEEYDPNNIGSSDND